MNRCSLDECVSSVKAVGMCEKHYRRMKRYGRTSLVRAERGSGTIDVYGYKKFYRRDHLLCSASGELYEHREVLFDLIGYGPHLCTHCGTHVNWGAGLVVDHLDWNRANNEPDNLLVSCNRCNLSAARRMPKDHQPD